MSGATYRRGHSYRRNGKTFQRCGGSMRYRPGQKLQRPSVKTHLMVLGGMGAFLGLLGGSWEVVVIGLGFVVIGATWKGAVQEMVRTFDRRRRKPKPPARQSHARMGAPAGTCWICKGVRPGKELTPTPLIFGIGKPKPICDYCMGRKKPRPPRQSAPRTARSTQEEIREAVDRLWKDTPARPAAVRFFSLRERGYKSWIDQDGYAVTVDREGKNRRLSEAEIRNAIEQDAS